MPHVDYGGWSERYTIADMKICHFGFHMINSMTKMLDLNNLTPFSSTFMPIMHHVKLKRFTIHPKKKGPITPSRLHHFRSITLTELPFHEPRPESTFNHAITPIAGGASLLRSNNSIVSQAPYQKHLGMFSDAC